jgi:hypothetical protein
VAMAKILRHSMGWDAPMYFKAKIEILSKI